MACVCTDGITWSDPADAPVAKVENEKIFLAIEGQTNRRVQLSARRRSAATGKADYPGGWEAGTKFELR